MCFPSFLQAPPQDVAMEAGNENPEGEGGKAWRFVSTTFFCTLHRLCHVLSELQRVKHKEFMFGQFAGGACKNHSCSRPLLS